MSLAKDAALLLLAGILGSIYAIVDKAFIGSLGSDWLAVESLGNYLPLILATLGKAVGQSLVVATAGEIDPGERRRILEGAIFWLLLVSVAIAVAAISTLALFPTCFPAFSKGGSVLFLCVLSAAWVAGAVNVACKYELLILGRIGRMIGIELFGNVLNIFGNLIAVVMFESPKGAFVGIAASTLFTQVALLLIYSRSSGFALDAGFRPARHALRDAARKLRPLLQGEASYMGISIALPFAFSYLLERKAGAASISAYNLGLAWVRLPTVALFSLILVATRNMASLAKARARQQDSLLVDLRRLANGTLAAGMLLLPAFWLQLRATLGHFPVFSETTALALAPWAALPAVAVSAFAYVNLRAGGHSNVLGRLTWLTQGLGTAAIFGVVVLVGGSVAWAVVLATVAGQLSLAVLLCSFRGFQSFVIPDHSR